MTIIQSLSSIYIFVKILTGYFDTIIKKRNSDTEQVRTFNTGHVGPSFRRFSLVPDSSDFYTGNEKGLL